MKAAQITQYGDASVVAISKDVPRPPTGGGKVLVEVHAASLNPADSSIRLGYMHQMMPLHFPATLGIDIAGVVVDAESGIGGLRPGTGSSARRQSWPAAAVLSRSTPRYRLDCWPKHRLD